MNDDISKELKNLRSSIDEFSKMANECNIIQTNHYSMLVGSSLEIIDYGKKLHEDKQITEYISLFNKYTESVDILNKCDCKKKI